jgi:hypothetical protein
MTQQLTRLSIDEVQFGTSRAAYRIIRPRTAASSSLDTRKQRAPYNPYQVSGAGDLDLAQALAGRFSPSYSIFVQAAYEP